jgi:hypothetical protein
LALFRLERLRSDPFTPGGYLFDILFPRAEDLQAARGYSQPRLGPKPLFALA